MVKMQKMYKYILTLIILGAMAAGCKKQLTPLDDNHRTKEDIYNDPYFAEGILMNAYTRLPTNGYSFNEVATDDAVTNDKFSRLLTMATGSWSATDNPIEQWTNAYTAILYLNLFLKETDSVNWSPFNKDVRVLFNDRMKGEAYALRAFFMFHLLQSHAGYDASGQLLGVPIIKQVLETNSDFKTPRSTFDQSMTQIYSDLTESEKYLPLDFKDISAAQLPAKYSGMAVADYNRVFGSFNRERVSGRIAKAIRAKAALLAASPAYNPQGTDSRWQDAANYAAQVLDLNGGLTGLDPSGAGPRSGNLQKIIPAFFHYGSGCA
jgi:hypothetical protein